MSLLETVLHADFGDMWRPGRHTLIIAQPRAGKTSFLLFCTAAFFKMGETVIVRDIGEFFEWFSMLDHGYPILGFVPKGCRILYEHENFEQIEFDVGDLNTIFDQLNPKRINLIFFESFCLEVRNYIRFWSSFFKTLLPWKQQPGHGDLRFALICDEFGDLAPGKGRTYISGQNQVSQLIAMNHRKFRRHNIRLVAAVHFFRDITPPIRHRFDCYVIKKNYPDPKEVPRTLQGYCNLFPKLEINKMLYVDTKKNFNQFQIKEEIPPQRFYDIEVEGNADKLMRGAAKDRVARLNRMLTKSLRVAKEGGASVEELAKNLGVSQRAIYYLLKGSY